MSFTKSTALFLAALLLLTESGLAASGELSTDDAKALGAYPLTMDKVQRKFAVTAELARLSVGDPAFQAQMQGLNQVSSLDGQVKALSAVPKAMASLQAHGITAHDYVFTTLAVNYAMMPQIPEQYRKGNAEAEVVEAAAPPQHVEFVHAHLDEIHKLTDAIMQARKEAQH